MARLLHLTGVQSTTEDVTSSSSTSPVDDGSAGLSRRATERTSVTGGSSSATLFPTVFDAIRTAQGITPYTDLVKVQVVRKRAEGLGGGRIKTNFQLSHSLPKEMSRKIHDCSTEILKDWEEPNCSTRPVAKAGQSNLSLHHGSICDWTCQYPQSQASAGQFLESSHLQLAAQSC